MIYLSLLCSARQRLTIRIHKAYLDTGLPQLADLLRLDRYAVGCSTATRSSPKEMSGWCLVKLESHFEDPVHEDGGDVMISCKEAVVGSAADYPRVVD